MLTITGNLGRAPNCSGNYLKADHQDAQVEAGVKAFGRRELEIELEVARTAALRADQQAFRSALDAAVGLLQRDFDTDSGEVEGALSLLREMRGLDVDPKRPDVGASLVKLRELTAKGR